MRLYAACWLLVAMLALGGGGALAVATAQGGWPDVALDAFYLAEAVALGVYLWRHPPIA